MIIDTTGPSKWFEDWLEFGPPFYPPCVKCVDGRKVGPCSVCGINWPDFTQAHHPENYR
jgi:hypothetical protein